MTSVGLNALCTYERIHIYIYIYICMSKHIRISTYMNEYTFICMYDSMYVCMYVCMKMTSGDLQNST